MVADRSAKVSGSPEIGFPLCGLSRTFLIRLSTIRLVGASRRQRDLANSSVYVAAHNPIPPGQIPICVFSKLLLLLPPFILLEFFVELAAILHPKWLYAILYANYNDVYEHEREIGRRA
jgi:hypothetical protein